MNDAKASFEFTKLIVGDLERAALFYKDVCGLTELTRVNEMVAGRPISEIVFNPTAAQKAGLVLVQFLDAPLPKVGELILGFTTTDLGAFLQRVRKAGGAIAQDIRAMPQLSLNVAFVTDTEGHLLEVVQMLG